MITKKNILGNQKGSALILVLVLIIIIVVISTGFMQLSIFNTKYNSRYADYTRMKWAAKGMLEIFYNDLQNNRIFLSELKRTSIINNVKCELNFFPIQDYFYSVKIRATINGLHYILKRRIKCIPFSFFSIFYNDKLEIHTDNNKTELPAPLFAAGNIDIYLRENSNLFFYSQTDFIYTPANITIHPAYKSSLILKNIENGNYIYSVKNGKIINKKKLKKHSKSIELPDIKNIYAFFKNSYPNKILIKKNNNLKKKKIVNSLLLEKELKFGSKDNNKFLVPIKEQQTEYVYFYKSTETKIFQKINPLKYADSYNTEKYFKIKNDTIIIDTAKKYKLHLIDFKINKLNRFVYANKNKSYASLDRNINKIYVNGEKFIEGNDGEINRKKREIYFYNPDFTEILGIGNGIKKELPLPDKITSPPILFIDNKRVDNYYIKTGKIVFTSPIGYGKKIYYYKYLPDIYFTLNDVQYNTKFFIDKTIEATKIDISKNNIILCETPVFITGEAKHPITIISTNDIFLGSINKKSTQPISIIGKRVWIFDDNENNINLNNIYIFTEMDKLYIIGENKTVTFKGAITYKCKYKNLDSPLSVERINNNIILYSKQKIFNIHFKYYNEKEKFKKCYIPYMVEEIND